MDSTAKTTPLRTEDQAILIRVRDELRHRLRNRLKQLVLFGSRARGDFSDDSDFDLLIIVDQPSQELEASIDEIAAEFLYDYNVVLSLLPISQEKFESQIYDPLLMNIRQEGVWL